LTRSTAPPSRRPRAGSCGCLGGPDVAPAWPQAPPGTTRAPPMALRRRSDLGCCVVGATGFEPVTSSVQIQRASVGLYIGWLEIRKDPQKAAGEARCLRPSAPIIHHNPPTIVMAPTTIGCCPSAAPTRPKPDLRDPNPNRPLVSSQLLELEPGDLRFLTTVGDRWRPLMTAAALRDRYGTDPARTELVLDTLSAELTVLNQTSVEHLWAGPLDGVSSPGCAAPGRRPASPRCW
jgi:hypothetical protein